MEWTISFLAEQQIVVIQTQGIADETSSLEMVKSLPKAMRENQAMRCLIDHRELSSVSGNSIEIYYRSKEISEMSIPSEVKIAEVVPPDQRGHFGFLETVCRNRGFDFRIFNDPEPAMQWLTS